MYGLRPETLLRYDHFIFPGAVPRTFVGSVMLAWIVQPFLRGAASMGYLSTKFDIQIAVRLALATTNAIGLCTLKRAVTRRFGRQTGTLFVLLSCCQFHLPYYMGRTLPNMFALPFVNLASSLLLTSRPYAAIAVLTFAAVVFRAELALLLVAIILHALIFGPLKFKGTLFAATGAGLFSLAATVGADSYFWNSFPLWPEFSGVYFNVYQGKSADWGVSPPFEYVTHHIPKLLTGGLPLAILGILTSTEIFSLLLPFAAFVAGLSLLGHKEWRFVVYVVPMANVAAAKGAAWLWKKRRSSLASIIRLFVPGLLVGTLLVTLAQTLVSMKNYPGGHALRVLHQRYNISQANIYIDNYSAQTGASLFLQLNSPPYAFIPPPPQVWKYDKTESLTLTDLANSHFTHVLTGNPTAFGGEKWDVLESIEGFERIGWRRIGGVRVPEIIVMDKLWIMQSKERSGR